MADETIGPEIPASHFAVAVPIRQHPGAYQKTKLIPYIVLTMFLFAIKLTNN